MKITHPLIHLTYESRGVPLEGIILKPEGIGPFPSIVHIHGFNTVGGWEMIYRAIDLVKDGYAVFLPSQMGFGNSEGARDYCGPRTVQGVYDGLQEFLKEDFVDKTKVGIWGISRGAVISSLMISQFPSVFKTAILQSGMYDFRKVLNTTKDLKIAENMRKESGDTEEAYSARSAIEHIKNISCSVLILHGKEDDTYCVEQATAFSDSLSEIGIEHETLVLDESGHRLPLSTRAQYILPFIGRYLKR
jgi:dipeptidyl aminopeptidase/acylaminoacyl peptidase